MATSTRSSRERAREYLRVAHRYRLGNIPTEQPHPRTLRLSDWASSDLRRAVATLKEVDLEALAALAAHASEIDRLTRRVLETRMRGRRVFLCGCGATGRLVLTLEALWRELSRSPDAVRAFMAGGDTALVHALEGFEDDPGFGARHLEEMGFQDGDLLISCTEGGETPYVIGATERAADLSSNRPCFLYCNTDRALLREVGRFRRLHANPAIDKYCLFVGPMALTGSTRMQASTALQLAVGLALLHPLDPSRVWIRRFRSFLRRADLSFLQELIERESEIYARGDRVLYEVRDYGITVFTDTTERGPTFSLVPFDQLEEGRDPHSLCYVGLADATDRADAWVRLLKREPRALNWPEIDARTTAAYLYGFDFSPAGLKRRRRLIPDRRHFEFRVSGGEGSIRLRLDGVRHDLPVAGLPELLRHLFLKQILNIHSTLVMGRIGRFEANLMTWVSPTNGKLVDRAVRYVGHLLSGNGSDESYERIVQQLFAEMEVAPPDESIVLRTVRALKRNAD